MFKPSNSLPDELSALRDFTERCSEDIGEFQENEHQTFFSTAMAYMNKRYKALFKNQKRYSDEHIAEQLFLSEIDPTQADNYYRCSWQALEKCLKASSARITKITTASEMDSVYLRSEITYLNDLLFEVFIFLGSVEAYKDESHTGYGFGKRNIASSSEVFVASIDHLHHRLKFETFASFVMQPISVFLIRQAIELRIKNAIGVAYVRGGGDIMKITPDFFIDFVYDRPEIKCPVNKSLVRKIHAWSNYFIHVGYLMPTWQIWFAQRVLSPLFSAGEEAGAGWSLYGAIKIEKRYYETKLDEDIKAYICERLPKLNLKKEDLDIEKIHPEALLV